MRVLQNLKLYFLITIVFLFVIINDSVTLTFKVHFATTSRNSGLSYFTCTFTYTGISAYLKNYDNMIHAFPIFHK